MATTVTSGPILSNVAAPLTTNTNLWWTIFTLIRPVHARKLQIINDGASTGAARVSIGDDNNPLYVPAGGSLSLSDVLIKGPVKAMRDAGSDLIAMKVQIQGDGNIETQ